MVVDLGGMFTAALLFEGKGLQFWDTSSVTNMFALFEDAVSFIGNISLWNLSQVKNISGIFQFASSFNGDLSRWDVSNVEEFAYAFSGASSFNRDISSWNVSSATEMIAMVSIYWAFGLFLLILLIFIVFKLLHYLYSFPAPKHSTRIYAHGDNFWMQARHLPAISREACLHHRLVSTPEIPTSIISRTGLIAVTVRRKMMFLNYVPTPTSKMEDLRKMSFG